MIVIDFVIGVWMEIAAWARARCDSGRCYRRFTEVRKVNRERREARGTTASRRRRTVA